MGKYGSSEGTKPARVGSPARRPKTEQGGGSMAGQSRGSFGKGSGKGRDVAGVTYEGDAGATAVNGGGNYNMVGSSAKKFC